jgi:hypothetical protein
VQYDVKEEIAEFFAEIGIIIAVDGLQKFRDFFNEAVANGTMVLFAIPWAAVRCPEAGGGLNQKVDAGHGRMQEAGGGGVKTIARSPQSVSVVICG